MHVRHSVTAAAVVGLLIGPIVAHAQVRQSLDQAIRTEAARMAADASRSGSRSSLQIEKAGLSAWAGLTVLDAGSEVVLTRSRMSPVKHRLLSVQDDSLTILDVSAPSIPDDVAGELRSQARSHPGRFSDARRGSTFVGLPRGIEIGPTGVSQRGRHLFALSLVVVDVPREDVVEVSVIRKHIGQHTKRGAIIGAVAGPVLILASCMSSECSGSDAGTFLPLGAIFGALVGAEYGFIVGLIAPRSADLVYRR